jgi:hypothetical protein
MRNYIVKQCKVVNDRTRFYEVERYFETYDKALEYFNKMVKDKSSYETFNKGKDFIETVLLDSKQVLEFKKCY